MIKEIKKKNLLLIVYASLIIASGFLIERVQAAPLIQHSHQGMVVGEEYFVPSFPDVSPPNYKYEEEWSVEVDGVKRGNMGFIRPTNPAYYNYGRSFMTEDKVREWTTVFNGNPNYVSSAIGNFDLRRMTDGKSLSRVHSVRLGLFTGAIVEQKKRDDVNYVQVTTTPFPKGSLTVPSDITAGKNFTIELTGEEFNPHTSKLLWDVYVGPDLKASGGSNTDKVSNKGITIQVKDPGTYKLEVELSDSVERKVTLVKTITVKPNPEIIPDPEPEPEPVPPDSNLPPKVTIHSPIAVKAGEPFCVSAYATDEDGEIVSYDWDKGSINGHLSGPNSCSVYYLEEGNKTISVVVTDNEGATADDSKIIKVLPPTPVASLSIGGTLKENRKVNIQSNSSSPIYFPIIWDKAYYLIEPLDGQKIDLVKTKAEKVTVSGNQYKVMGTNNIDSLFKTKGRYKVTHYVENTAGYSDITSQTITITEDMLPIADFSAVTTIYRDNTDNEKATAVIKVSDKSYSIDDKIAQRIWTYTFDSNNDGSYEEENPIVIDTGNKTEVSFETTKVGKYKINLLVVEEFDQETIEDLVTPEDRKRQDTRNKEITDSVVEVKNLAPVAGFDVGKKKTVELQVAIGNSNYNKTTLTSKINEILKPQLAQENIDLNLSFTNANFVGSDVPDDTQFTVTNQDIPWARDFHNLNYLRGAIKLKNGNYLLTGEYHYDVCSACTYGMYKIYDKDFNLIKRVSEEDREDGSKQAAFTESIQFSDGNIIITESNIFGNGRLWRLVDESGDKITDFRIDDTYYNRQIGLHLLPDDRFIYVSTSGISLYKYQNKSITLLDKQTKSITNSHYEDGILVYDENDWNPYDGNLNGISIYSVVRNMNLLSEMKEIRKAPLTSNSYSFNGLAITKQGEEVWTLSNNRDLNVYRNGESLKKLYLPDHMLYMYKIGKDKVLVTNISNWYIYQYNGSSINLIKKGKVSPNGDIGQSFFNLNDGKVVTMTGDKFNVLKFYDPAKFDIKKSDNYNFAVAVEDQGITNDGTNLIKQTLEETNSQLIALGTNLNKDKFSEILKEDGLFIDNSKIDDAVQKMSDFIINQVSTRKTIDLQVAIGDTTFTKDQVEAKLNEVLKPRLAEENIKSNVLFSQANFVGSKVKNDWDFSVSKSKVEWGSNKTIADEIYSTLKLKNGNYLLTGDYKKGTCSGCSDGMYKFYDKDFNLITGKSVGDSISFFHDPIELSDGNVLLTTGNIFGPGRSYYLIDEKGEFIKSFSIGDNFYEKMVMGAPLEDDKFLYISNKRIRIYQYSNQELKLVDDKVFDNSITHAVYQDGILAFTQIKDKSYEKFISIYRIDPKSSTLSNWTEIRKPNLNNDLRDYNNLAISDDGKTIWATTEGKQISTFSTEDGTNVFTLFDTINSESMYAFNNDKIIVQSGSGNWRILGIESGKLKTYKTGPLTNPATDIGRKTFKLENGKAISSSGNTFNIIQFYEPAKFDIKKSNNYNFAVAVEDQGITNEGTNLIKQTLEETNSQLIALGTNLNKDKFSEILTKDGLFIDNSKLDEAVQRMADFIIQEVNGEKNANVILAIGKTSYTNDQLVTKFNEIIKGRLKESNISTDLKDIVNVTIASDPEAENWENRVTVNSYDTFGILGGDKYFGDVPIKEIDAQKYQYRTIITRHPELKPSLATLNKYNNESGYQDGMEYILTDPLNVQDVTEYIRKFGNSSTHTIKLDARYSIVTLQRKKIAIEPEYNLGNKLSDGDFVITLEDGGISEATQVKISNQLAKKDVDLIAIGSGSNKATFSTLIRDNGKGLFIENTQIENSFQKAADYIIQEVIRKSKIKEIYLTLEEQAEYFTYFEDAENDPKFADRWRYDQNPNVFENNTGYASFNLRNLADPIKKFEKVGRYQVIYAARDNPIWWGNDQFDNYRLWSKEADNWYINVHRKPIPNFSFTINSITGQYNLTNKAYDLDKQSVDIGFGGGIKNLTYQWREQGQSTWNNGLPSNPLSRKVYEVKQDVEDFQGAKASITKLMDATGVNKAPIADFIPIPEVVSVDEDIFFNNLSYDQNGDPLNYQWTIRKADTQDPFVAFSTLFEPTRTMNIEGEFEVKLRVTDTLGATDEVVKNVNVVTNNQAPTAGFNYKTPQYIGDTIKIESTASDPDGDPLTIVYSVSKENGTVETYSSGDPEIDEKGNLTLKADNFDEDLGIWFISQVVSDGQYFDEAEAEIEILNQTVKGQVNHTQKWDENRKKYNLKISGNEDTPRGYSAFFPGEKFVINADATETATEVIVTIKEYPQYTASLNKVGSVWEGFIWNENMLSILKDEELTFEFTATHLNGWISSDNVKIQIKDDPYWRQHTTF